MQSQPVNILLVDDQPAKLLTYKAILSDLGQNLLTAASAREALEILLRNEVAIVLVDVYMPDIDGFELAAMIRDHPRYQDVPIIFISAILLNDVDRLRGYEMGGVDYVSVPVIPEVLRAKVAVFLELSRKTRQLERLNGNLELRVAERTAELAAAAEQLRQSEQLRRLALAAGDMGCWEWDARTGTAMWDEGHGQIFGVAAGSVSASMESLANVIHPDDLGRVIDTCRSLTVESASVRMEFRAICPGGEVRWCVGAAAASFDANGALLRVSGVTVDITERKQSEQRQTLLAEEVDHRARNVVAVIQSMLRITRATSIKEYISAVDGRIGALSTAHKLLANSRWEGADLRRLVIEEFAPYRSGDDGRVSIVGPETLLSPAMAQTIALALHELVTNAAKHGALSEPQGRVELAWRRTSGRLMLTWCESGGPLVAPPRRHGYGTRIFKAGIEQQLKGRAEFLWEPEGLQCTLTIPLYDEARPAEDPEPAKHDSLEGHANSILLVEDEPTVALMLADLIGEFGYEVDGPYNRLASAMRAAQKGAFAGAVLDVNLEGEVVYPLADLLLRRRIPFVFVTGYSEASLDRRFSAIPLLQKPVDSEQLRVLLEEASRPDAAPAAAAIL